LAPLTDLCGQKTKFIWADKQESALQKMKEILAQDVMLTFPEFDQPCERTPDKRRDHAEQPNLRFFTKKLSDTQQQYPVTEHELLAIAETHVVRAPHNHADRSQKFNPPKFDTHF
jgi:hypothetical protein